MVRTTYECEHCGASFSRRNNRDRHYRRVHEGYEAYYQCSFCNSTFNNLNDFNQHINHHQINAGIEHYQTRATALNGVTNLYRRNFPKEHISFEECFSEIFYDDLLNFFRMKLLRYPSFKINLNLRVDLSFSNQDVSRKKIKKNL